MGERRIDPLRARRFLDTKMRLSQRLSSVCGNLPPDEREALFERMATVEIKYVMRRSTHHFNIRSPEPDARRA